MTEALSSVSTGQVTYAVRDTSIDGKAISNGDIMGIGDKGLLSVGKDIDDTVLDMLSQMIEENEDAELVSLYYGEEISEEQAEDLAGAIEDKFDDIDVEVQMGGQPVYYYLVSVE
jgi:hypothetical protein